jgi:hypothetical protein
MDKFKKENYKAGYKTVATYPAMMKAKHVNFYERAKRSVQNMRDHESVCKESPSNLDMLAFFAMVRTSVCTKGIFEEVAEIDDNGGDDALANELESEFGMNSSSDNDESRVVNNSEKLVRCKGKAANKKAKHTNVASAPVELAIEDIKVNSKYAVMVRYGGDNDESDGNADQATGKRDRRDDDESTALPLYSWFVGQVVSILADEGQVRIRVFKKTGENWYPMYDEKKPGTKTILIEMYTVQNLICAVEFNRKTHYPNKASEKRIVAFFGNDNCEPGDKLIDQQEFEVTAITEHRISKDGLNMEYKVQWDSGKPSWEPAEVLENCGEILRLYESKNLDSKELKVGARVMLSCTPKLLSNRHIIDFFHFKGHTNLRSHNFFSEDEMLRLVIETPDVRARWVNSTMLLWFIHEASAKAISGNKWAIFSPFAATKFMGGITEKLQRGFVDEYYSEPTCRYWLIPVSWVGNEIPR